MQFRAVLLPPAGRVWSPEFKRDSRRPFDGRSHPSKSASKPPTCRNDGLL